MKRANWQPVSFINILLMAAVVVLVLIAPFVQAQQKVDERFDRVTCWNWGGSGGAGQGQYISCPVNIVRVTETRVERVQIPGPPVPGPVRIERVEVPAPPAKKVRD